MSQKAFWDRLIALLRNPEILAPLKGNRRGSSTPRLARYLMILYLTTECPLWNTTPLNYYGLRWFSIGRLAYVSRGPLTKATGYSLPFDYSGTALRYYTKLEEAKAAKVMKDPQDERHPWIVAITPEGRAQVERMVLAMEKADLKLTPALLVVTQSMNDFFMKSGIEPAGKTRRQIVNARDALLLLFLYHVPALLLSNARAFDFSVHDLALILPVSGYLSEWRNGEAKLPVRIERVFPVSVRNGKQTSSLTGNKLGDSLKSIMRENSGIEQITDNYTRRIAFYKLKPEQILNFATSATERGLVSGSEWWVRWLFKQLSDDEKHSYGAACLASLYGNDAESSDPAFRKDVELTIASMLEIAKPCLFRWFGNPPWGDFRNEMNEGDLAISVEGCEWNGYEDWGAVWIGASNHCERCCAEISECADKKEALERTPITTSQLSKKIAYELLKALFFADITSLASFNESSGSDDVVEFKKGHVIPRNRESIPFGTARFGYAYIKPPHIRTPFMGSYDTRFAFHLLQQTGNDEIIVEELRRGISRHELLTWCDERELLSNHRISIRTVRKIVEEIRNAHPDMKQEIWFQWLRTNDSEAETRTQGMMEYFGEGEAPFQAIPLFVSEPPPQIELVDRTNAPNALSFLLLCPDPYFGEASVTPERLSKFYGANIAVNIRLPWKRPSENSVVSLLEDRRNRGLLAFVQLLCRGQMIELVQQNFGGGPDCLVRMAVLRKIARELSAMPRYRLLLRVLFPQLC